MTIVDVEFHREKTAPASFSHELNKLAHLLKWNTAALHRSFLSSHNSVLLSSLPPNHSSISTPILKSAIATKHCHLNKQKQKLKKHLFLKIELCQNDIMHF